MGQKGLTLLSYMDDMQAAKPHFFQIERCHLAAITTFCHVDDRQFKRYGRCGRLGVRVGERLIHYSNIFYLA